MIVLEINDDINIFWLEAREKYEVVLKDSPTIKNVILDLIDNIIQLRLDREILELQLLEVLKQGNT